MVPNSYRRKNRSYGQESHGIHCTSICTFITALMSTNKPTFMTKNQAGALSLKSTLQLPASLFSLLSVVHCILHCLANISLKYLPPMQLSTNENFLPQSNTYNTLSAMFCSEVCKTSHSPLQYRINYTRTVRPNRTASVPTCTYGMQKNRDIVLKFYCYILACLPLQNI